MADVAPAPRKVKGIVKMVRSADSIIVRDNPQGKKPRELIINLNYVKGPAVGRTSKTATEVKHEKGAWEGREYLRKLLVGKEVYYIEPADPKSLDDSKPIFTSVFFPTDRDEDDLSYHLFKEGWVCAKENLKGVIKDKFSENTAKDEKKGIYQPGLTERTFKVLTAENIEAAVKKYAKKPVKAIVESVPNTTQLSMVLLPACEYLTLLISGIANSRDEDDDNKQQGQFFVECRLLQQEVDVILESHQSFSAVGSVIHPKGNIAEFLLMEGFVKCFDKSISAAVGGAKKLREAEKFAKEKRLRIWRYYEPPKPRENAEKYYAIVTEIIGCGDGLAVRTGKEEKRIFLSSIRPPRLEQQQPQRDDEEGGKAAARTPGQPRQLFEAPFLLEAREFVRKKVIGKKVEVILDYKQPQRDIYQEKECCTVKIGNSNLAVELVSMGLATVVKHREGDEERSADYDALMEAENLAKDKKLGIHGKTPPKLSVIDCTLPNANKQISRRLLPVGGSKRMERYDAVVEYVASGSRIKVFIPKESTIVTFLLSGVSCPRAPFLGGGQRGAPKSEGEPFGEEAFKFVKDKIMHRDIEIEVETSDKAGNIIGCVLYGGSKSGTHIRNLCVDLVEAGLAKVHQPSAVRLHYYKALESAEEKAKAARLKVWENYDEEEKKLKEAEEANEEEIASTLQNGDASGDKKEAGVIGRPLGICVLVTTVTDELELYAQHIDQSNSLLQMTEELRRSLHDPTPLQKHPRKGELVAAKFSMDKEWYRAKVERVSSDKVNVLYVDYGNREVVHLDQLAVLPSAFGSTIKPFAHQYALAWVRAPPSEYLAEAMDLIRTELEGRELLLRVQFQAGEHNQQYVTLSEPNEPYVDVIERLLLEGLLMVVKRNDKRTNAHLDRYRAAQEKAKKEHVFIWEYGDVTEDDAKEFGLQEKDKPAK